MPRLMDTIELVERVGQLQPGTRGTVRVEGTYLALVDVAEAGSPPAAPEDLVPVPYRAMRRIARLAT
jgi:hypothetical protein